VGGGRVSELWQCRAICNCIRFYVSISDCYLQLMSRYFQLPVFVCLAFAQGCAHDAGTQLNVGGGLSLRVN
jgi:hypothetical protein